MLGIRIFRASALEMQMQAEIERLQARDHQFDHLSKQMEFLMTTTADINAATKDLLAKVQNLTDAEAAIKTYVSGLKDQLAAAIQAATDAGAAHDDPNLDEALANLKTIGDSIDADTASDAVLAGTAAPATPAPAPADPNTPAPNPNPVMPGVNG